MPKNQEIHLILDNDSIHQHAIALNWIERFFSTLTQKQIRRGVFHSVDHLERNLKDYIQICNENPDSKPGEISGRYSRKGRMGQAGTDRHHLCTTTFMISTLH